MCLAGALLYLRITPPVYERTATVLVKDSRKGAGAELTAFSDIMGGIGRRSVENELYIFSSRQLMEQVVLRYNLTTRYTTKEGLREVDIYGKQPMNVTFLDNSESLKGTFTYKVDKAGRVHLSDFSSDESFKAVAMPNDTIATPLGKVVFSPTTAKQATDKDIKVRKQQLNKSVESYRKKLKCAIADKQASVINITMSDQVPQRAEDIINGIIEAYNQASISDKQEISLLTAQFINDRLMLLGNELNMADDDVATYKQSNRIYNPQDEATLSAEEIKRLKENALSLEANIEMANYILQYVMEEGSEHKLIPASTTMSGGASQALAANIDLYNKGVLEYQRLVTHSSQSNPAIVDLEAQLDAQRTSIIAALQSHIETLNLQIAHINREQQRADSRMEESPKKEKELLSIVRQQKVKEELYIYLLTKLEENALTGATAESNARIIDMAYGSDTPIKPKKSVIFSIAICLGLLLPFVIAYLCHILNTKVESRRELQEALSAPYLGDIPRFEGKANQGFVVKEDGRDALSEAFRMVAVNLSFMSVDKSINVIMTTSSIPHSGKTFISSNLAFTLAASGKRVVLIDLDLRRRTLSKIMGHRNDRRGITSYLSGNIASLSDIITKSNIHANLDMIFAGPQPPNPTEMLMSAKMEEVMAELRTRYDYIIIDCAPAMAVADAIIMDRLVDLAIYVVRSGNLDYNQLPDIEHLYRDHKFHNMGILFNGVKQSKHGYGYGYYGEEEELTAMQRRWRTFKQLFKRR